MNRLLVFLVVLAHYQTCFSQTISSDSLVLHLPFDGDAKDVSGNGYNGIIHGATPTAGENNLPNTAYHFDGKSSIVIPDIKKLDGTLKAFTILIKLQVTDLSIDPTVQSPFWTAYNFLTWHRNSSDSGRAFLSSKIRTAWQPSNDAAPLSLLSYIMEWCNISGTASGYSKDTAEVINKWFNVAYVYNAGKLKVYHNCSTENNWDVYPPESSLCGTEPIQVSLGNVPVAAFQYGYRYFRGNIDDLRIYSRALSEQEVKIYSGPACIEKPVIQLAVNKDACKPSIMTFADVSDMKGWPVYSRTWHINGDSTDTAKSLVHQFTVNGSYAVKLTVFTDSVTSYSYDTTINVGSTDYVRFMFPKDSSVLVCEGKSLEFNVNGYAAYQWQPCTYLSSCDSKTVTITPATDITYKINGTDNNGCKDSVELKVKVIASDAKVFVPNAFTPNGDYRNDTFGPLSFTPLPVIDLNIYNRFGAKIFSSGKQNNKWDGTFKGTPQPAGVYIYTLGYSPALGCPVKHEKGTLQLIR